MTRDQQNATKALEVVMEDFLRSYGWQPADRRRWRHPKLNDNITYPLYDAFNQTNANKKLGWP